MKHVKFDRVRGYATYEGAQKRGEDIAAERTGIECRWVVIALPGGRYAPLVILNNGVPGGPGSFIGEHNVCLIN